MRKRIATPSCEVFINNTELTKDKLLTTFFTASGVTLADLSWIGSSQQVAFKTYVNLQIEYDGHNSENLLTHFHSPKVGHYFTNKTDQLTYFKTTDVNVPGYSINLNSAYTIVDGCTLMLPDMSEGVAFDLRCKFIGTPDPAYGNGFVEILASIDQLVTKF